MRLRSKQFHLLLTFALTLSGLAAVAAPPSPTRETQATPAFVFAVPQPGYTFAFPRDHGSHPAFKLEWWYVTGHLFDAERRRFGFQATFFRQAAPDGQSQIYLAHMALVDPAKGTFLHQERLNRAGWDADAAEGTLAVRNGPWSLGISSDAPLALTLKGGIRNDARFILTMRPQKPLTIFGENSVSRKGADSTAASYYLTFTRLAVEGELTVGAEPTAKVTGEAWMDHEISSSQLSPQQVGWDWLSVQLKDEPRELMLYRLRLADGTADPASTLQWVDRAGRAQKSGFTWKVLGEWTSPATGATYPARVELTTPDPQTGKTRTFLIEPLLPNQELTGELSGIPYWEGACRVSDLDGKEIGSAYMELTGYAEALKL